ncbi:C1 1 and/or Pkinase C domain containing protein [Asbolus verrucosus]|uniref:C1 1 and/or Pkinase C domain containing protein n=1 Tax=Asbolus verrucosus TaxID=1661398 RepID=A0A482VCR3_ASBVE|nr:C1 1 and/or Pkinase C domain containing protein [Asbolus verrucosus]
MGDGKQWWSSIKLWRDMCEAAILYSLYPTLSYDSSSVLSAFPRGSIYRRGARRWRKLYRVNGHIFQAKRFNRRAFCAFCNDRIWGLGRQGFKCIQCKLLVHKKCHKLVQIPCTVELVEPSIREDHNGESPLVTQATTNEIISEIRDREYPEPPPDVTDLYTLSFDSLEQKQIQPPYKPRLDSDRDLANFPPEFTDEPVHLTPDDPHVIEKIDQSEFEGFEYVNPLLMSLEDCV